MKGLLLKDLYMAAKYCRSFLFLVIVFLMLSLWENDNIFFTVYPTMIAGIIPMTLLSYDERNKWTLYSRTLPYSGAQLVTVKYLIGLMFGGLAYLVSLGATVVRMTINNYFSMEELLFLGTLLLVLGLIGPMLLLPFVFKYGTEKGRIIFYVMIGFLCAASVIANGLGLQTFIQIGNSWIWGIVVGAAVVLYLLSWRLSILFYQKREL